MIAKMKNEHFFVEVKSDLSREGLSTFDGTLIECSNKIKNDSNFIQGENYRFFIKNFIFGDSIGDCIDIEKDKTRQNVIREIKTSPKHYDNSKGSLYQFAENQNLNSYEFDIIKRIIRCRKKGLFREDLEKTKFLIDLYLKEYEEN